MKKYHPRVEKTKPLKERVFSSLAYHMRHRHNDGAEEVIRNPVLIREAGSEQALHASLTTEQKLAKAESRRGASKREKERLSGKTKGK